jgi:hypothetical protein
MIARGYCRECERQMGIREMDIEEVSETIIISVTFDCGHNERFGRN